MLHQRTRRCEIQW